MSIVIAPNIPPVAAPSATTADIILQPGSVISARVLQNPWQRPGPDCDRRPVDRGHFAGAAAGRPDAAASGFADRQRNKSRDRQPAGRRRREPGLRQFGRDHSIPSRWRRMRRPASRHLRRLNDHANNPLTALETLAVSVAAESAATQQTSLAPLFANLGVAAGLPGLPPQVQQAVAQVLAQQTSLDQNLTGSDIKQAFQASGLFLEASLASGSVSSTAVTPDLKAALIVLRQALTTSLSSVAAAATPGTPAAAVTAQTVATAAAVPQVRRGTAGRNPAGGNDRSGCPAGTTPAARDAGGGRAASRSSFAAAGHHNSRTGNAGDRIAHDRAAADVGIVRARSSPQTAAQYRRRKFSTSRAANRDSPTAIDAGGYGGASGRKQRGPESVAGNASGRPAGGRKSVEARIRKQPDACRWCRR